MSCNSSPVSTDSGNIDPKQNTENKNNPLVLLPNHEDMIPKIEETDAPMSNNNVLTDEQSGPLPRKRKALFFISYSIFVTIYLAFFFLIAFTYPLQPVCHIHNFYLTGFDNRSPNITEETVNFYLKFNNRNRLIPVSYDNFLNVAIYFYNSSSDTFIPLANKTLPGFYQHKRHRSVKVQAPAPGLTGFLKKMENVGFRVHLEFGLRFHCRELGKHKHRFWMNADVVVSTEDGKTADDYSFTMNPNSS